MVTCCLLAFPVTKTKKEVNELRKKLVGRKWVTTSLCTCGVLRVPVCSLCPPRCCRRLREARRRQQEDNVCKKERERQEHK